MKFTKGYWLNRNGVQIANAVQVREVKQEGDKVYLYIVPYERDERAMGGPVLEMYISSPEQTSSVPRPIILWAPIKKSPLLSFVKHPLRLRLRIPKNMYP